MENNKEKMMNFCVDCKFCEPIYYKLPERYPIPDDWDEKKISEWDCMRTELFNPVSKDPRRCRVIREPLKPCKYFISRLS